MTTYTAALEALDVKRGHVHTVTDWHRVGEKAQHTPETLTDDDLIVLEGFGGPSSAAVARVRREKALAPLPPPEPPAAPATKATAPALTRKTITDYFMKYSDTIFPILKENFSKQKTRIDALEQRLATLEKKPHLKFRGVYEAGKAYSPGDATTRSGSLWVCTAETTGTPGEDFHAWKLAVKKGTA